RQVIDPTLTGEVKFASDQPACVIARFPTNAVRETIVRLDANHRLPELQVVASLTTGQIARWPGMVVREDNSPVGEGSDPILTIPRHARECTYVGTGPIIAAHNR